MFPLANGQGSLVFGLHVGLKGGINGARDGKIETSPSKNSSMSIGTLSTFFL